MKYRYFEKEGALFRGAEGVRFVEEVKHGSEWVPYAGDVFAPVMFGDEITAEDAGESAAPELAHAAE